MITCVDGTRPGKKFQLIPSQGSQTTLRQLKILLSLQTGSDKWAEVKFVFQKKQLEDDQGSLFSYGIPPGEQITFYFN